MLLGGNGCSLWHLWCSLETPDYVSEEVIYVLKLICKRFPLSLHIRLSLLTWKSGTVYQLWVEAREQSPLAHHSGVSSSGSSTVLSCDVLPGSFSASHCLLASSISIFLSRSTRYAHIQVPETIINLEKNDLAHPCVLICQALYVPSSDCLTQRLIYNI